MKVDLQLLEQLNFSPGGSQSRGKESPEGEFALLLNRALEDEAKALPLSAEALGAGLASDIGWVDAIFAGADSSGTAHGWLTAALNGEGETDDAMSNIMIALMEPDAASASYGNQQPGFVTGDQTVNDQKPDAKNAIFAEIGGQSNPSGIELMAVFNKGQPDWIRETRAGSTADAEAIKGLFVQEPGKSRTGANLSGGINEKNPGSNPDFSELFSDPGKKASPADPDISALASLKGKTAETGRTESQSPVFENAFIPAERQAHLQSAYDLESLQGNAAGKANQAVYNPGGEQVQFKEILAEKPASRETAPITEQSGIQQHLNRQPGELELMSKSSTGSEDRQAALRAAVTEQVEGRLVYLRERGSFPAEMRLTLNPPELGEVKIRVMSRQGQLSASIVTESALVKEIIESSISELRQRINFVHIQFEQLDVSTAGKEAGGSEHGGSKGEAGAKFHGNGGNASNPGSDREQANATGGLPQPEGIEYWA